MGLSGNDMRRQRAGTCRAGEKATILAMTLERITVDPDVMGGRPCIRGMRMPVSRIIGMLAAGEDEQTILTNHPDLEPEDIRQALTYAAMLADNQIIPLHR
jgi:uncharacterized protein (DUF433 family)